jgi:uncharacterized repeat protein (TIGR01451 family)
VVLQDFLPTNSTYVSSGATQGSCNHSAGTVTCDLGSIADQGSVTVTIVVTADSGTSLSNQADVSANETDSNLGNDSDTTNTSIAAPSVADLSVTKTDAPDPVLQGDDVTYIVTVANAGPVDATGVTLTDTLSSDLTFVSTTPSQGTCNTPVGQNVTCDLGSISSGASVTVTVVATAIGSGTVSNTANVSANETDSDLSNNSSSEDTMVNAACVDLTVTKTDSSDPVLLGDNVIYGVEVLNVGSCGATGVTLTDKLPSGLTFFDASPGCSESSGTVTCDLGLLAAGASKAVFIRVTPTSDGTITNTVSVNPVDINPDDNSDTEVTTVLPNPNISALPASHDFGNVLVPNTADVEITVSNSGVSDLNVSGMSLTNTTDFALDVSSGSGRCGTSMPVISPSASCAVTAIFMPQFAASITGTHYTADLSITSDDPDESTLDVSLSGVGFVDTDGDGVDDSEDDSPNDATVATPSAATGTGKIILDVSGIPGASLAGVSTLLDTDPSLNPANKPNDFTFPDGLVSFTVNGVVVGSTVDVVAVFPSGLADGFKHFKVDGSGFFDYTNISSTGDTLTITLVDGGSGDLDGAADGSVDDPSGVAAPVSTSGGDGGGGGGGCFIATAAYGSYEAPYVKLLREFRDDRLLTNKPGKRFVELYYKYSPPAASWLEKNDAVKPIVRILLLPLIAFAWILLKASLAVQLAIISFLILSLTIVSNWLLGRRRSVV